jgi:hypothetical protein
VNLLAEACDFLPIVRKAIKKLKRYEYSDAAIAAVLQLTEDEVRWIRTNAEVDVVRVRRVLRFMANDVEIVESVLLSGVNPKLQVKGEKYG